MSMLDIIPVTTKAELDRFIKVPAHVNAGDPNFVVPLMIERQESLSPKKNPYFAHAETQFWLAVRDGRDVGRISAQVDRLIKDPAIGHFGMISAEDDPAIFTALFAKAEEWLRARGKTRIQGPFNLSINEETGLLVDGFDTPPKILMGHDPRYAAARVEEQGYRKAKDLLAYRYYVEQDLPPAARRLIDRRMPTKLTVRTLDTKRYSEEFRTVFSIFNDAWSENWGYVPFTDVEVGHMAKSMKPLVIPERVVFIEYDGEAVGFIVALPNLHEAIADFDGKLLPFNWIKLLMRLKRGTVTARVPLMGIRKSFGHALSRGIAPFLLIDQLRKSAAGTPTREIELGWILEDNMSMRNVIESLGATAYKTYRVYEKTLGAA